MVKLTKEIKLLIVDGIEIEKKSQRKLFEALGIPQSTIHSFYKKYRETGMIDDLPRIGRPMKTTLREQRHLILLSKKNPMATSNDLKISWNTIQSVSLRTTKRILNAHGLFGRICAKNRI